MMKELEFSLTFYEQSQFCSDKKEMTEMFCNGQLQQKIHFCLANDVQVQSFAVLCSSVLLGPHLIGW